MFYTHNGGLYFSRKTAELANANAAYTDFFVRFDKHWFKRERLAHDAGTIDTVTILGVTFGRLEFAGPSL